MVALIGGAAVLNVIWNLIREDNPFDSMLAAVLSIAKFEAGGPEINFIVLIYNLILPAAFGLLLAYTMYEILTKAISLGGDMSLMSVLSPIIRLILGYIFLMHADIFIGIVIKISNLAVDEATAITSAAGDIEPVEFDSIKGFFAKMFFYVFGLGALAIAQIFPTIMVIIEAVKIKVGLMILLAFLPFGIANICGHEYRGGIKYIKRIMATAFFLFAMLMELYVARGLGMVYHPATAPFEAITELFVFKVCLPFTAIKAIQITKKAVERAWT